MISVKQFILASNRFANLVFAQELLDFQCPQEGHYDSLAISALVLFIILGISRNKCGRNQGLIEMDTKSSRQACRLLLQGSKEEVTAVAWRVDGAHPPSISTGTDGYGSTSLQAAYLKALLNQLQILAPHTDMVLICKHQSVACAFGPPGPYMPGWRKDRFRKKPDKYRPQWKEISDILFEKDILVVSPRPLSDTDEDELETLMEDARNISGASGEYVSEAEQNEIDRQAAMAKDP